MSRYSQGMTVDYTNTILTVKLPQEPVVNI